MQEIRDLFARYKENMDRQHTLDEVLMTENKKDNWIPAMKKRSEEMLVIYEENEQIIQKMKVYLEEPLSPEYAEVLYEETYHMYWNNYDDCQVLIKLLQALITYYEPLKDTEKLLFLYGAAYYEENEIQSRRGGRSSMSMEYNEKVLGYKQEYVKLKTVESRSRIFRAYYNIIVAGLGNKAIDIKTSYRWYKDMLDFWHSEPVRKLDGRTEEIVCIVERISREWLAAEEYIEQADKETKENFCRLADYYYEKECKKAADIYEVNSEVYAAWLHAQTLEGKTDFSSILDLYMDYYLKKLERRPESCNSEFLFEDFYFIINTPLTLERWLHYGIDEEKCRSIILMLKEKTEETWYRLEGHSLPFLDEIMADWCLKVIKYLDNQVEKEDWLFGIIIKRQLPTYLHSVMVMYLAESIFREAVKKRPDLFDDIKGISSDGQLEFVRKCALLHDIGKIRITDIINTQGRRLSDREFGGIRMHPEYGAQLIAQESDLAKYKDVILGHHKFYDGKGGYPADYDNTVSEYRIIVDLITICDCIDAATDTLGRNYKKNKGIKEVLAELEEGKGQRYHPDLVDVIADSPELIEEMGFITGESRMDIMYLIYSGLKDNM